MTPGERPRCPRSLRLAFGLLLATGCTGGGTVHMVPLMRSDLPPGEPLLPSIPVSEACYWTDDDARLNIALCYRAPSVLGKKSGAQWLMSIVLDGLPAGSEKLYQLGIRAVRAVQTHRGDHRRSRSVSGIAVVHAPQNGRMTGRFHVWVRQQRFGVLTGWSPPMHRAPLFIAVGSFEAVADPDRGREILDRTEADGFDRLPRAPTTRTVPIGPTTPATGPGP